MSLTTLVVLLLLWALVGLAVALVTGRVLRIGVGDKRSAEWPHLARRNTVR